MINTIKNALGNAVLAVLLGLVIAMSVPSMAGAQTTTPGTGGTVTPGVPNTGNGSEAGVAIAALALLALAGTSFLLTQRRKILK